MSGSAWEYVMGVMVDENGTPMSGRNSTYNSGFNGSTGEGENITEGASFPALKYYDIYTYASVNVQYQRRILGDATGEMGPFASATYLNVTRQIGSWYSEHAYFSRLIFPWFVRGGIFRQGRETGVFAFKNETGYIYGIATYRIILTPTRGNS